MEQIQVRVGFGEAVKRAFSKCFCFSGRASRSEYWWFVLFYYAVLICILWGGDLVGQAENLFDALIYSWVLICFFPHLCLCCRRLHDIEKSGLCIFEIVNPLFGWMRWLIWMCTPSDIWENDYGEVPNVVEIEDEDEQ